LYEKFQKLLEERGITAYKVSKETGVATATLTEWKNGTYQPKVDKLMLIAKFFDVPIEYFLTEDGDKDE
jgi:transcriptional regulator with XRE-family HTH domain